MEGLSPTITTTVLLATPLLLLLLCPYQISYTCFANHHNPTSADEHTVIQFRHGQVDLWGNGQARQLHGSIVPLVIFRGTYEGLYVYTSSLALGIPYSGLLMAIKEPLSLDPRLRTVDDLAKALTYKAQVLTQQSSANTSLSHMKLIVDCFEFQIQDLKRHIITCILKIEQQDAHISKLPIVLTHMDMTSFKYLVDAASGQVTAILDWDGAEYLPVGRNFHFVEHLFRYMTRDGWEDSEDREVLESFFHQRVCQHLVSQGFDGSDFTALEREKTLGTLIYYVPKLLEWKEGRAEGYLQHFFSWERDDQN